MPGACPTGSIVRTEFGSVYVQPDICNGCGYCVVGCPFGVIDRRPDDGRAFKCTFCYDRQKVGLKPACAKACPTESIKFGELETLRSQARGTVEELHARGNDGRGALRSAGLQCRRPPRDVHRPRRSRRLQPAGSPEVPTIELRDGWRSAALAGVVMLVVTAIAFLV